MAYTNIKKSSDYFNTVLYTSNGGSSPRTISGVGHNPDMIWVKNRDSADYNHVLADKVRGTTNIIYPDTTSAEAVNPVTGTITSTNSDGFVITAGSSNLSNYDTGSNKQVVWSWKANGAGVANTDGDIASTVSANTTSGFSIVKWSGTSATGTIGHGLGVAPKVVIVKALGNTEGWYSYWQPLGNDKQVLLNSTSALGTTTLWNNTTPTSSVFSVVNHSAVNGSSDYIAYCFADVQGFAKMGSYTGNGNADGTFIYTGFKPAFVLVKQSHAVRNWLMFDNKRNEFNIVDKFLIPNTSGAEQTSGFIDFTSNGFKFRTTDAGVNENGGSYIYMAFAEQPLVGDNPATAR